jgi:hypothetical protein
MCLFDHQTPDKGNNEEHVFTHLMRRQICVCLCVCVEHNPGSMAEAKDESVTVGCRRRWRVVSKD